MSLFRRRDERLQEMLEEAGRNAARASSLLRDMFEGFPDGRDHLAREILKCEQEGDRIAHDIIHRLHDRGVHSPMPRTELHALVSALDDIVDYAEETADSLGLYGVEAPMEQAQELASLLERAAAAVLKALEQLVPDGHMNGALIEIHELEN